MSAAKTLEECLDRCEEVLGNLGLTHETARAFDQCWDRCDERFAAGKEPSAPIEEDPS